MAFRSNQIQVDGSINIDGSIFQWNVPFLGGSGTSDSSIAWLTTRINKTDVSVSDVYYNVHIPNPSTGLGNTDGHGIFIRFVAGATILAQQLICISTNGRAYAARADASVASMPAVAINHSGSSYSAGTEYEFLMLGAYRHTTESFAIGKTVYVSSTGYLTTTPPSTIGHCVQPVGVSLSGDAITFNPIPSFIVVK